VSGTRRERAPRAGRFAGLLLLAVAALAPAPAMAWVDPLPGTDGIAATDLGPSAIAGPGADLLAGIDLTASSQALGFWLGPIDDAALRARAVAASGLPVGADGEPIIGNLAEARALRTAIVRLHARADGRLTHAFVTQARALGVTDVSAFRSAPLVVARVTPAQAAALASVVGVQAVEPGGDVQLAMATA